MAEGTGACGVNCLVCGLFRQGKCGCCGSGLEEQAQVKLAAQLKIMGGVCPILQCAVQRKIAYCSADCRLYPCHLLMSGPYPFSQAYLEMQLRRRGRPANKPPADEPAGGQTPPGGRLH
ncbi:hypothetical protein Deba_2142 [Desulfarculus baarsii DSM 2075]|uniref:DUF3795 domain-containing protein n=1 Tax=Desulfarculus baarsii (strain ATCC 33931 / DSM 2075 / LMG 7858 / VKM B-1802 / 2st14) TaxID=644282 RepID=E1QIW4_DESB2|nr:hypothetical protein [Desulfarculus baarsii]ADK85507.1 hypothetical protein Deba_2142 [Desulfarculus baarsii DSM 2075]